MTSRSLRRTRRALGFSGCALIAVVVGMKLLSRRTYDASNPRSRPNGYLLSHSVHVARSSQDAFDFSVLKRTNGRVRELGTCNAYVYFDLDEVEGGTRLTQTIVIEMPNFLIKFITDVMGARRADNPWQRHLVEELESLKAAIEHESPV